MSGRTKRQIDAELRAFLNPPPMTIAQALETRSPVSAIGIRLSQKPVANFTTPERVFFAVSSFVADAMNGGLEQALTNDTGELFQVMSEFASRYGTEDLRAVLSEVAALFPSGTVPSGRDARTEIVEAFGENGPLGLLTERFYKCNQDITDGLIALVRANMSEFCLPADKTQ